MKNRLCNFSTYLLGALMLLSMAVLSCGESRTGWSINGNIAGASDQTLFIEEQSGAAWVIVDSVKADGEGNFSFTALQPVVTGQPIYRLRLGENAVYFPIEGSESLTLSADTANMSLRHSLSGSIAAAGFNRVDSLIALAVDRVGADKAADDPELVGSLADIILNDSTCVVGYYALMRPVENKLIFNVNDRKKLGLIGALATRYKSLRPNDPRGAELEQRFIEARRAGRPTVGQTMEATLSGRPDLNFVRKDEKGNDRDLNAVLDRGGVTVVNFIRYDDKLASANTLALGEAYKKYKDRGVEIFQIGFDPNRAHWQQNALSMPWTTVYSSPDESGEILVAYNVNPLDGGPTTLLFNRNGELVKRVTNPADIDKAIAEIL